MKNILALSSLIVFLPMFLLAGIEEQPKPCSTEEAAQFDFWLGEWQLHWTNKDGIKIEGTNSITRILGDCTTYEHFKDPSSGYEGMSYSVYSSVRKKWLQTWVDSQGSYLDFVGEFMDGKMIMQRKTRIAENEILQRMIWYNIARNEFDWNWEKSSDGGKSWDVVWQIHYTRIEADGKGVEGS